MTRALDKKERARQLFVTSTFRISQIADSLSIPVGTLNRWIYEGKWVDQKRSSIHPDLVAKPVPPEDKTPRYGLVSPDPIDRTVATPTTVTVVPDEVPEEKSEVVEKWEALAGEHERSYKELRQLAQSNIRSVTRKIAQLQKAKDTETIEAIAMSLPVAKTMGEWAKVLDMAIKGERTVTSAHYHDLNNAIGLIRKYGYDIVAPLPIDQPDETDSPESTQQGISPETSDRILRESLGIEPDSLEIPEEMDS